MTSLKAKFRCGFVVTVQTHTAPHLDEILALLLAILYATPAWVKQYCPNLVLQLGTGHGPFDEHPDLEKGRERVKGESCATLVAKSLGVDQSPQLARILKYALDQDLTGQAEQDDFAVFIKTWHLVNAARRRQDDRAVIEWAQTGLRALLASEVVRQSYLGQLPSDTAEQLLKERDRIAGSPFRVATMMPYVRQHLGNVAKADAWEQQACQIGVDSQRWFEAALNIVRERAEIHTVEQGPEKIRVCVVTSDNPFVSKAYRSRAMENKRSDVIVQFKRNGQFLIATSANAHLRLTRVAALLRNALIGAKLRRGLLKEAPLTTQMELRSEGYLRDAEEIYYFRPGSAIMNGSITNPDVTPLTGPGALLTKNLIVRIVDTGIQRELQHVPRDKRQTAVPKRGRKVTGSEA